MISLARSPRHALLVATSAVLAALAGCKENNAGTPGTSTSASATAAASSAKPAPRPAVSHVPPTPHPNARAHSEQCEVEMFGKVKPIKPGLPTPVVFASYDDCLKPDPVNIGQTSANPDGTFFLEVFVKWGSDLHLCAHQPTAADPKKPSKAYAKATGPFHAEKEGEVEFKNIEIELKDGPARTFPGPRPSGGL